MTTTPAAAPDARKTISPGLKFALELGPLALFFITYKIWDYIPATIVLMASVALTLGVSYRILRTHPDHAAGHGRHGGDIWRPDRSLPRQDAVAR